MLNRSYLDQFFELEGPPFGNGQPLYTSVGLWNYVANGDVEIFFDFLICKQTVDTYCSFAENRKIFKRLQFVR